MNELVTPLLLITALGLLIVLVSIFRNIDAANRVIDNNAAEFSRFPKSRAFLKMAKYYIYLPALIIGFGVMAMWLLHRSDKQKALEKMKSATLAKFDTAQIWTANDPLSMLKENDAQLIQYGRDLIAHTADYLGPQGIVNPLSNGMNCQNCHLDAGSKPFGNNYSAVAATYPKFRARSGTAETIAKRVNDCFQRSLNGQA